MNEETNDIKDIQELIDIINTIDPDLSVFDKTINDINESLDEDL